MQKVHWSIQKFRSGADIVELVTDPSRREDLQIEGLRDSIAFLREVIREETKAVSPKNVILLGLSQGSATGKFF